MNDMIVEFLIKALVLFTALPVHEFAHGWVATKFGDDTPRIQGRLTLSPFVHLDIIGSLCMLFTGFGWAKPVMVNKSKFKHRKIGSICVALAGPLANILLALIVMIIIKSLEFAHIDMNSNLHWVFWYLIVLNTGLAVFNLLPVPPLDGSQVLLAVLSPKVQYKVMQYQMYIFIGLLLFIQLPFVQYIITWLNLYLFSLLDYITSFIGRWV